jgi:hypothetical protein
VICDRVKKYPNCETEQLAEQDLSSNLYPVTWFRSVLIRHRELSLLLDAPVAFPGRKPLENIAFTKTDLKSVFRLLEASFIFVDKGIGT